MEHYYSPAVETADLDSMRRLQNEKLCRQVRHAWDSVPYYRHLMEEKGVTPDDIRSVDDLRKLPFLSKADLRDQYPYGLLGVPLRDVVRIHSTSGTTGRRVVAFYTKGDVDLWETCIARALTASGASAEDVVQVAYGYGLFTGGFGIGGGSQKIGALTLPMSSGNTERQIQFMQDLHSTVLCCTPSYAAYLGETIREMGVDPASLDLRIGIFGAEPWTEEMRRDIEASLGIRAFDIYGLTEISGPGVAFECSAQSGMHINEDHFYPEIVDPDTGEVLPDGEPGELVFTCLDKEAFPLIRYRTRDICVLSHGKCACGRTLVKMCKPQGRSDDMMIIRGVNVFPSQIEAVLLREGYTPNYRIEIDRVNNNDTLDIFVELSPEMFTDTVREMATREKTLTAAMRDMIGIGAHIHLVAPHTIERSEGKAVRVIDKRHLHDGLPGK